MKITRALRECIFEDRYFLATAFWAFVGLYVGGKFFPQHVPEITHYVVLPYFIINAALSPIRHQLDRIEDDLNLLFGDAEEEPIETIDLSK